ncbi:iron-binding protein [Vulcanimicrobium alpinum]|uniref:Iron-binding protein n=1 Tax=Vulcanimicrobium alpinum TaxID=3016050 RepID=A0AAN1XZU7_UNVUL|nr:CDGSH iron-sulfur domain-containing protein [Vulcanimicrobium alpinum]BDE07297.1 iron-binding protein [Vulcanimicrobium alpinum]
MSDQRTPRITITENGPYLVYGAVPLQVDTIAYDADGGSEEWQPGRAIDAGEKYALCRCGRSANKPFCDGTHACIGFDGTETASREPYAAQATTIEGPAMVLQDADALCAFARFCDPHGSIWKLIKRTDEAGARALVEHEATHCPSGRLVVRDKTTGAAIEPESAPSIELVEDPGKDCSGPLWVRGGIPITSSDGTTYEVRNRVTLCRCGASTNKPFCDGTHADIAFKDGF